MTVFPMFLMASVLLILSASLLWLGAGQRKKVVRRRAKVHQSLPEYVRDLLQAAGIRVNSRTVFVAGLITVTATIVVFMLFDSWQVPFSLILLLVVVNAAFRIRVARLRQGIRTQMPGFLDQLNRDLAAGQGFDISFRRAVSRLEKPLRPVMDRVINRVNLGQDIDECIQHEAMLLKSFELELLATIVSVNLQHGGSIKSALDSFIHMIRQDERNKKELSAMTGETRVTAWVMGSIPLAILGLMFVTNREFINSMLSSEGGQTALIIALVLQAVGALTLYRMLSFK